MHAFRRVLPWVAVVITSSADGHRSALADEEPERPSRVLRWPVCARPAIVPGDDGRCVLVEDAPIAQTLRLASGTTLDCQGHRVTPKIRGDLVDPQMPETLRSSVPEIFALIDGVCNTRIENCVVDGHDFGVVVLQSEGCGETAPNVVASSELTTRYQSVLILDSDDTLIADSTLRTTGGVALLAALDADRIRAVGNTFSAEHGNAYGVLVPGTPFSHFPAPGPVVVVAQTIPNLPTSLFLVIDGVLRQLIVEEDEGGARIDGPHDTLLEGNVITSIPEAQRVYLVALVRLTGTRLVDNAISGTANSGITLGGTRPGSPDAITQVPGRCSGDETRRCLTSADCSIAGWDLESKGTCEGTIDRGYDARGLDAQVIDNIVSGRFTAPTPVPPGIAAIGNAFQSLGQEGLTITGNRFSGGTQGIGNPSGAGIYLGTDSRSAVVSHNVLTGNNVGVQIGPGLGQGPTTHPLPRAWTGRWFANDIVGNSVGIVVPPNTTIGPVDLSSVQADGVRRGNHWGHGCDDARGFPASLSFNASFGYDSAAYGEPIAGRDPASVLTCVQQGY
jgi:hypothetical protein